MPRRILLRRPEPHPVAAKLGERVRRLRQKRGMSIWALARMSGISRLSLLDLEEGRKATIETIIPVVQGLNVLKGFLLIFPQDGELFVDIDITK